MARPLLNHSHEKTTSLDAPWALVCHQDAVGSLGGHVGDRAGRGGARQDVSRHLSRYAGLGLLHPMLRSRVPGRGQVAGLGSRGSCRITSPGSENARAPGAADHPQPARNGTRSNGVGKVAAGTPKRLTLRASKATKHGQGKRLLVHATSGRAMHDLAAMPDRRRGCSPSIAFGQGQRGAAEPTFGKQPANQPMRAPAAWAVVHRILPIHGMIATKRRIVVSRDLARSQHKAPSLLFSCAHRN